MKFSQLAKRPMIQDEGVWMKKEGEKT